MSLNQSEKGHPMLETDQQQPIQPQPKPLLTVEQQIAHMKSKGITFDLCTEADAAAYLRDANNYLRAASYRKLYPRRVGGERDGQYIGLDFEALRRLSSADRVLRSALREVCIDVEHFARVRLLARTVSEGEDGYAVIEGYLADLRSRDRSRVTGSLGWRAAAGDAHDEYAGDLIARYRDQGYPLWVFLEAVEFGRFKDLWLYCAKRWGDQKMLIEHYTLKSVAALRNAACHNRCIINGLSSREPATAYETPSTVLASMNERGMGNSRTRRKKMSNPRVSQIASALYLSSELCERDSTRERHAEAMASATDALDETRPFCPADGSLASYFDFIETA